VLIIDQSWRRKISLLYINITEECTHVFSECPMIIKIAIYIYEIEKIYQTYIPSSCKVLLKIFNDSTTSRLILLVFVLER
jgi:hypothetical protein